MVSPAVLKDKFVVIPFVAAAFILLISFSIAYINFVDYRGLLIVHYDAFRGPDFFGNKSEIFGILAIGLAVILINGFLADELYWRERFLTYFLSFGTIVFSLLILMAIIGIISIN